MSASGKDGSDLTADLERGFAAMWPP